MCLINANGSYLLRRFPLIFTLLCLFAAHGQLWAHAKQESYIWLNMETDAIVGRVELNYNDVRNKLNLDLDKLGPTRHEGLLAAQETLQEFIKENYVLTDSQGVIPYDFDEPKLFAEGADYLQFPYRSSRLPSSNEITIENSIWLVPPYSKQDPFHRSMIVAQYNHVSDQSFGDNNVALVFTPNRLEQMIDLDNPGQILNWKEFFWQGALHIGIGLDHILFIAMLLLGVVMKSHKGTRVPVENFKTALWNTFKIVTIFTVAHSITLSLAALNLVNVEGALVETIIALSIIAMALNNIFPVLSGHSWILVFAFGLFHGLGFASVMGDLQFRLGALELILVMFNVGVEFGQLVLVVVLLPILFLLRKKRFYQPVILVGLSLLAIVASSWWVIERAGALVA